MCKTSERTSSTLHLPPEEWWRALWHLQNCAPAPDTKSSSHWVKFLHACVNANDIDNVEDIQKWRSQSEMHPFIHASPQPAWLSQRLCCSTSRPHASRSTRNRVKGYQSPMITHFQSFSTLFIVTKVRAIACIVPARVLLPQCLQQTQCPNKVRQELHMHQSSSN